MNKRGQSLPLNTLVIIILVVIVLIVVAVFFLGGTSSLSRSIRNIFYGTTAGTDLNLAVETCQQRCELTQRLSPGQQKQSAYCKTAFQLDLNNDGKIDLESETANPPKYKEYFCYDDPLNVQCPNVVC